MKISSKIQSVVSALEIPNDLGFGKAVFPVVAISNFNGSNWSDPKYVEDKDIHISAASPAVQYAQTIFEGMKAYRCDNSTPRIFRAVDHANRFNVSASRLCIPNVPTDLFLQMINSIARLYADKIPNDPSSALYLRPTAMGIDTSLTIEPSEHYAFMVYAAPTLPFSSAMKSVLIERSDTRASIGGTGGVKAAGNYAGGFLSLSQAHKLGCATTLWLDPKDRRNIEELSLMNFFAVIDGVITTPPLKESYLPGLTRQSILTLAQHLGIEVSVRDLAIDELISRIEKNDVTEAFSCGTAAVVSPIKSLVEKDGTKYQIGSEIGPITEELKVALTAIQHSRSPDLFNWMSESCK